MASLWDELRQRNVVKVAVSYAIVEEVEADLETQLELMRKMDGSGEFAPVPDLVVTQ